MIPEEIEARAKRTEEWMHQLGYKDYHCTARPCYSEGYLVKTGAQDDALFCRKCRSIDFQNGELIDRGARYGFGVGQEKGWFEGMMSGNITMDYMA